MEPLPGVPLDGRKDTLEDAAPPMAVGGWTDSPAPPPPVGVPPASRSTCESTAPSQRSSSPYPAKRGSTRMHAAFLRRGSSGIASSKLMSMARKGSEQTWVLFRLAFESCLFCKTALTKPLCPQLARFVDTNVFEGMMGMVICANTIMIGLESDSELRQLGFGSGEASETPSPSATQFYSLLETLFLVAYVIELTSRFLAAGVVPAIRSHWVKLDIFLVCMGITSTALLGDATVVSNITAVRLMRLGRLVRVVRLVSQFDALWTLVRGLMNCGQTLLWTFIFQLLSVFCFAIMAMELIPKNTDLMQREEYATVSRDMFSSLSMSMFSLFRLLFLDGLDEFIVLCKHSVVVSLFFFIFTLCNSVALMNFVTASMIESSTNAKEREMQRDPNWLRDVVVCLRHHSTEPLGEEENKHSSRGSAIVSLPHSPPLLGLSARYDVGADDAPADSRRAVVVTRQLLEVANSRNKLSKAMGASFTTARLLFVLRCCCPAGTVEPRASMETFVQALAQVSMVPTEFELFALQVQLQQQHHAHVAQQNSLDERLTAQHARLDSLAQAIDRLVGCLSPPAEGQTQRPT